MQTIFVVILLASLAATVSGINCYSCESVYETSCGEDFDVEPHFKLDCSRVAPPRYMEEDLVVRNSTACMKKIYKEHGLPKIVRTCFFGDVNDVSVGCQTDPTLTDLEEIACYVCDTANYCNDSSRTRLAAWSVLCVLLTQFISYQII